MPLARRQTLAVRIGKVTVGGGNPIVVQSMTDTDTADCDATVQQILNLASAGSEIVRITVNNADAARQVPFIKERLNAKGCDVPLVGDFHYNGHQLLQDYPACAAALDKYRINPGNVGFAGKRDKQFRFMIETALHYDKPIRIGVNWGSLDKELMAKLMDENAKLAEPRSAVLVTQEALVLSALQSAELAQDMGLPAHKIILSCKVSDVQTLIAVYRDLASRGNYALHLGLTEAGMGSKGIVAASVAMGILLQEGIGDTIRTSLTPEPGADRVQEVIVSQQILQVMGLRAFTPMVTACPGCGRTKSAFFRQLAEHIQQEVRAKMPQWREKYPGVESMTIAVMGCIVNGPGESKHANIGISLPGTGEEPSAPVFMDGVKVMTLRGENIAQQFSDCVEQYVVRRYG